MGYLTFVSFAHVWRVYGGVGVSAPVLGEHRGPSRIVDLSGGGRPILWICGDNGGNGEVQLVSLPHLDVQRIPWQGRRTGAIAGAPDDSRAVVTELPDQAHGRVQLHVWDGRSWSRVATEPAPDIASRLAWIDMRHIVYETSHRRLALLDIVDETTEVGPAGQKPVAAVDVNEWYAICDGRVLRFSSGPKFSWNGDRLRGFSLRPVADFRVSRDGRACTWAPPRFPLHSKAYVQERGRRRRRLRVKAVQSVAVLGPY